MLNYLLDISDIDKKLFRKLILPPSRSEVLKDKSIGCIYEKPSTRTRVSFAVGVNMLGGKIIELKLNDLNFSRKETIEDTFKTLGCYLDGLIYRTSSHSRLLIAQQLMDKPVINALSEKSHPCQIVADLMTLNQQFKTLEINICWFGDMNNVLFSLVQACNLINEIKLNIFSSNYIIKNNDWKVGKNVFLYDSINHDIISKADCIMTDTYISMNDKDSDEKVKNLIKFQVDSELMSLTKEDCVFMHCLPATVGLEVTKEVIESKKSIIWKQAKNRLPAQLNIMQCINWY